MKGSAKFLLEGSKTKMGCMHIHGSPEFHPQTPEGSGSRTLALDGELLAPGNPPPSAFLPLIQVSEGRGRWLPGRFGGLLMKLAASLRLEQTKTNSPQLGPHNSEMTEKVLQPRIHFLFYIHEDTLKLTLKKLLPATVSGEWRWRLGTGEGNYYSCENEFVLSEKN